METSIATDNLPGAVGPSWRQDFVICANCGNFILCRPTGGTSCLPEDTLKTTVNGGSGGIPAALQTRSESDNPWHKEQRGFVCDAGPSRDLRVAHVRSRWCVYAPKQDCFKDVQDWCPRCGCIVLSSDVTFPGKTKTGCKPPMHAMNTPCDSLQHSGRVDNSRHRRYANNVNSCQWQFSPMHDQYTFRSNEILLQQAAEAPEDYNLQQCDASVLESAPASITHKSDVLGGPLSFTTAPVSSARPWIPSNQLQDWGRGHCREEDFEAEANKALQTDSTSSLGPPGAGPKRSSSSCLTYFSLMAMTLGALVLVGILLFLLIDPTVNRPHGSMALEGKIPAVISKVNLRILNMDFQTGMDQPDSTEFYRVVVPFTQQINLAFLDSSLRKVYYGATVTSLGKGSIVTDFNQVFEDNGNIKSPDVINDVIYASSKMVDYRGVKALKLGDFVICSDCINTTLQYQTLDSLPEKPLSSQPVPPSTSQESSVGTPTAPTSQEGASATPLPLTTQVPTYDVSSSTLPSSPAITSTSSSTASSFTSSPTLALTNSTSPAFPSSPRSPTTSTAVLPSALPPASYATEATTPTTTPGAEKPVVSMPDVIAYRDDVNTSLTCLVSKARGWTMIIIMHKRSLLPLLSVRADGTVDLLAPDVLTSANVTEDSAHVTVVYRRLQCGLEGSYTCEVITGDPTRNAKAVARFTIKDMPGQPELTLPPTAVEGQVLSQPIQCSAVLGFPEAFLSLTVLTPGEAQPRPLPSTTAYNHTACSVAATAYASLRMPTPDLNGSVVICSLDHTHKRPGNFSATATMTVLKADVCLGSSADRLLPHPHSCSHFLNCTPSGPEVQPCPDLVCFDPVSSTCGKASLTVESSVRPKDEGLTSVGCRLLNFPLWETLTLRRVLNSDVTYDVLVANVNGSVTWLDQDLKARALSEFQNDLHQQQLRLWIYVWKCFDHGTFECLASSITNTSMMSVRGQLDIQAAPSSPKLDVPLTLVEGQTGQTARISCQSDVGFPSGVPSLTLAFPNGTEVQATFDNVIRDTIANCLSRVTGHYDVKERDVVNGTVVTCYVNSSVRVSPPVQGQLLALPADVCGGVAGRTPHPLQCGHYVDCSRPASPRVLTCPSPSGACLDMAVTPCPLSPPNHGSEPGHACPPNGQVTLPHPTRCHVFLLCRDGRVQEQACREGELYLGDGTCTTDVRQSQCFSQAGP